MQVEADLNDQGQTAESRINDSSAATTSAATTTASKRSFRGNDHYPLHQKYHHLDSLSSSRDTTPPYRIAPSATVPAHRILPPLARATGQEEEEKKKKPVLTILRDHLPEKLHFDITRDSREANNPTTLTFSKTPTLDVLKQDLELLQTASHEIESPNSGSVSSSIPAGSLAFSLQTSQHTPPQDLLSSLNTSTSQQPNPGSTWHRRLTKTRSLMTMTGSVKRSLSTPNVQQAAAVLADSGSLSYSADKRRNKLGYHRTSVACGHCRRRKIRCLLAKEDLHGRCSNCIRLKKECNFYPVESTDRRPRSMSKPDNSSSQELASSASSPSPGYGLSRLQPAEGPRGYPASVPVTPTYFSGSFDDSLRHSSLASSGGQIAGSRSSDLSRKPSLAHLHAMPLALKVEQGYLSSHDGFPRRWELASQADPSTPVTPVTPITAQPRATLEDPSTTFWRLNSSDLRPPAPFIPSQPKVGSLASFSSIDSIDIADDGWSSQVPSRVGSVDHSIAASYSFAHSAFDAEYAPPPELCSASASTASLTASISEASQYGGDSRPTPGQFYMGQWGEQPAASDSYSVNTPAKSESLDSNTSYANDAHYSQINEENPFLFPSPLHSPAPVSMSHV